MAILMTDEGPKTPEELSNVSGQAKRKPAKYEPRKPKPAPRPVLLEPPELPPVPRRAKEVIRRPTCPHRTKTGAPCTARCMADHGYCTDHRPPHLHLKPAEREAFSQLLDEVGMDGLIALIGWGQVREWVHFYERSVTKACEESTRE